MPLLSTWFLGGCWPGLTQGVPRRLPPLAPLASPSFALPKLQDLPPSSVSSSFIWGRQAPWKMGKCPWVRGILFSQSLTPKWEGVSELVLLHRGASLSETSRSRANWPATVQHVSLASQCVSADEWGPNRCQALHKAVFFTWIISLDAYQDLMAGLFITTILMDEENKTQGD